MRNATPWNIAAALLILIVLGSFAPRINRLTGRIEPKPGEVWVYTIAGENPFRAPTYITNTVLAVSNGWVQYKNHDINLVCEQRIDVFMLDSQRLQP